MTLLDLKRINGCLSRLIEDNNGAFRARSTAWQKIELDHEESIFYGCMRRQVQGLDSEELAAFEEAMDLFFDNAKFKSTEHIKRFLSMMTTVFKMPECDLSKVDLWEAENKEHSDHRPGFVHLGVWEGKRRHDFPSPHVIESSLEEVLALLQNDDLHPIEKAARVWYEIVQIHPWDVANKRTGKGIGSMIFLEHGYLPPLISEKGEAERFGRLFIEGFEKEDGYKSFVEFIAHAVEKTQQTEHYSAD